MDFEVKTDQEAFWQGGFGDDYIERHRTPMTIPNKVNMLSRILARTRNVNSVIEFGSNVGLNLQAMRILRPDLDVSGIEINSKAHQELSKITNISAYHASILDPFSGPKHDLTMSLGVMIHISPDHLEKVYDNLYNTTNRYVLVAEYYNPSPVALPYRNHDGKLFKRDFAGEMLDRFSDLTLVDYAFQYHRDPVFPQDDLTWFLLEKS